MTSTAMAVYDGYPPPDLRDAVRPLRMIFWGGLLCIFDLTISQTTNGQGFKLDILSDLVGCILIAVGVFSLARFEVSERFEGWMTACKVLAAVAILHAFIDHFIFAWPSPMSFLATLLSLANLIAIVAFCVCMRWLSESAALQRSPGSWSVTTVLFVAIYLVPLGLFYVAALLAIATGSSFNIDLGPLGLLLLPVFAVPLIHLFMSTSRMASEADDGGGY